MVKLKTVWPNTIISTTSTGPQHASKRDIIKLCSGSYNNSYNADNTFSSEIVFQMDNFHY